MGKAIVIVDCSLGKGVDEPPPNMVGNKIVSSPLPTRMIKMIPQTFQDCLFLKTLSPLDYVAVEPTPTTVVYTTIIAELQQDSRP